MKPTDPIPELRGSAWVRFAGFLLVFTGIFTAAAGVQILVFTTVFGPARYVPPVMLALGVLSMVVGSAATMGRFRAVMGGLVLALLSAGLGVGWFGWAAMNAFFSLMQVIAMGLSLLSVPVLGLALKPAWSYSVARERLLDGSPDAGMGMYYTAGPPQSPWPSVVAIAGTAALLSPLALGLWAPEVLDRLTLRIERVLQGSLPWGTGPEITQKVDFSYPWSPFREYMSLEKAHVDFDAERAERWANDIADEVALRMLTATDGDGLVEAELALWQDKQQDQIPLWIAEALRSRGVFYSPESLMSRSFDPTIHRGGGEVHLDCDQLVYLFLHVASRLDLDMRAVPSAFHMYLAYFPPEGVESPARTVETTSFRRVDVDGNRVDFLGRGIGEDFFIDADYHREGRGGIWASDALAQAARLYEPADAEALRDAIVANLVVGLERAGSTEDLRGMLEAERAGTHDFILVSNLHQWTVEAAQKALDAGELETAIAEAQRAAALRAEYGVLVSRRDPTEALVLIRAQGGLDQLDAARESARTALRLYRDDLEMDPWDAQTPTQTALVELATDLGLSARDDLGPRAD